MREAQLKSHSVQRRLSRARPRRFQSRMTGWRATFKEICGLLDRQSAENRSSI
jgi:hypothetical protein